MDATDLAGDLEIMSDMSASTAVHFLEKLQDIFSNVTIAPRIFLSIPVSQISTLRRFSKLSSQSRQFEK
jgi:hypothetical protein